MEENKNQNPETQAALPEEEKQAQAALPEEKTEEKAEETAAAEKPKKEKRKKKPKKAKRIRNQAFFKRGSYSLVITALVLAGIVVLNVMLGFLEKRVVLEVDMTPEKVNSISKENIAFLKDLDTEVEIIVCSTEEAYTRYMSYLAQNYSVSNDATEYYNQTLKLLEKYTVYNDKITLRYVDSQGSEFAEISATYSVEKPTLGDVIVRTEDRYRILGFDDIYALSEDNTYASYGYSMSAVSGNNVETAVTGAIAYVTSTETKRAAVITGHSGTDYTALYQELLKDNNYELVTVSDSILNSLAADQYDALILAAPDRDFLGSELDAISEFLENDGKLGKGLIYFANASAPRLPNLYEFLSQWGITVNEGILFETSGMYHMTDDPTTMISAPCDEDKMLSGIGSCLTGLNASLEAAFESEGGIEVKALMSTAPSVVTAPIGTPADWTDYDNLVQKAYPVLLQAVKQDYDEDNNAISSYVMAFSSTDFIQSEYLEYNSCYNKNITLAGAERAVGTENSGISFVSKSITSESFTADEASTNVMKILFQVLLPLALLAAMIIVYFRRKNA